MGAGRCTSRVVRSDRSRPGCTAVHPHQRGRRRHTALAGGSPASGPGRIRRHGAQRAADRRSTTRLRDSHVRRRRSRSRAAARPRRSLPGVEFRRWPRQARTCEVSLAPRLRRGAVRSDGGRSRPVRGRSAPTRLVRRRGAWAGLRLGLRAAVGAGLADRRRGNGPGDPVVPADPGRALARHCRHRRSRVDRRANGRRASRPPSGRGVGAATTAATTSRSRSLSRVRRHRRRDGRHDHRVARNRTYRGAPGCRASVKASRVLGRVRSATPVGHRLDA